MTRKHDSKQYPSAMARPSRRQFLKQLSAVASATVFAGCGGGEDADASAPTTPNVGTSVPPVPPPLTPPPTGTMQFFLSSPVSGTQPFAIGFAFKQGDIPTGYYPVTDVTTSQVNVLTHWPDGSAKWGVVAGRKALTASTPATVALSASASAPSGTALTTTDLIATGITAAFGTSTFGSASWSGSDWSSPFRTWVSGPEMSSWIYRKPIGSDAHLVAWMEVRLFADDSVEVLPWVENGYLLVAGPTEKPATYTFTLGGTERFNRWIHLTNHSRTPLISGTMLSHWLGTDPNLNVRHDPAYLQSTELVPTYFAVTPAGAASVTNLPSTYIPLQQGSYPDSMGQPGYHLSIGLIPEWDVLYLTCQTSDKPWKALQYNAYSAGRFGIYYRDETTNRPIRFSSRVNLVMGEGSNVGGTGSSVWGGYTPLSTGANPARYTNSHTPSMGYMAALITGRAYHVETVQFHATANYLKNGDWERQSAAGIFRSESGSNTTRGAAWSWRTLAQAACITPEDDTLYSEMVASMTSNINYTHSRYVAQANNPQGWVTPYSDFESNVNSYDGSCWQQDFYTAAVGYANAMGLPLTTATATKLDEFFAWKARSIVGRFGGTGTEEYLYRDAAQYTISLAPSDTPNFSAGTGPWYTNWGQVWTRATSWLGLDRLEGDLRGGFFPGAGSYWGNLQPALAYAVRFGVPGAEAGYARMTGAANWSEFETGCDREPVWGVRPAAST